MVVELCARCGRPLPPTASDGVHRCTPPPPVPPAPRPDDGQGRLAD